MDITFFDFLRSALIPVIYCQVCGWDKEIEIVDDDRGKLIWKCPNCGNTDKSKMNIARRTCGYIGLGKSFLQLACLCQPDDCFPDGSRGGDKQRLGEARGHIPDGNETGQ